MLAVLIAPGVASANGRYPAAGQIALSPAAPDTLLVRTTYGLALTKDGGHAWSWICEDAMGVGSQEDPMLAFAANGAILASTYGGLDVSANTGCDWAPATAKTAGAGTQTGLYAIDLAMEKGDASKGVGLVAATATGVTYVVETSDDGASWTQTGVPLPASFVGLTLETAPSHRERLYVSGRLGVPDYPAMPGVIARSDDRGATWQTLFIAGKDVQSSPYISGVDPNDPDVLYVRLDGGTTDELVVSKDGGATWTKVFETSPPAMGDTSNLLGFALSPDGATVAVGGPKDGLWTAPASTLAFARVSTMSALCLTWGKGGLYGCADELNDGFTAGVSTDGGQSWTPLLHRAGLCGPLTCAPDSAVTKRCTSLWPLLSPGIGDPSCNGAAAGSAGATASSSSPGESAGGPASDSGSRSCACSFAGTGTYEELSAAVCSVLFGALALGARRRRVRREG